MKKKEFHNKPNPTPTWTPVQLENKSKGGSTTVKNVPQMLVSKLSSATRKCKYETATTCHGSWKGLLAGVKKGSETAIVFVDGKNEKQWMMLAHHAQAVGETAENGGYTVFFRDAGKHTLDKLVLDYPTKGHDILDKTLKDSSLEKTPQKTKDFIEKNKLHGFVGVYSEKQEAIGVRTTGGILLFKDMKGKRKEPPYPYTGDYDMLDLLNTKARVVSQGGQVVAKGTEHYFMNRVNDNIGRQSHDTVHKQRWHDRWCTVRHGAQALWPAFAYWHHEVMFQVLVKYSLPVMAFTHQGCIHFVETIEEMERFYTALGPFAHPPPWWLLGPYALERQKHVEQSVEGALPRLSVKEQKELKEKTRELRKSLVALDRLNVVPKESDTSESSSKKLEPSKEEKKYKKTLGEFMTLVNTIFYNPERAKAARRIFVARGKTKGH